MTEEVDKPECQLSGTDGNIFALTARASTVLKRNGLREQVEEMQGRVTKSGSYHEALAVICEYVDAY